MKKLGKHAQADIQFHWIFILIAGGIILTFFVSVSVWYKGNQEGKLENTVVLKLDSLFTTAIESPRTAKPLQIPDMTLSFTCDPTTCGLYSCASDFSGGGISQGTETEVIFAHHKIKGNNLVTWALQWEAPFPVANFLYVTNDRIRYVLVYEESEKETAEKVNEELQQNSYLNKQFVEYADLNLEDYNDDFVRIVVFDASPSTQNLGEEDFASVYDENEFDVIHVTGDDGSGQITFNDGQTEYVGLPLLLGAIFSPSKAFYDCNKHKAMFRLRLVATNYQNTKSYYDEYLPPGKTYCYDNFYAVGTEVDTSLGKLNDPTSSPEVIAIQVDFLKQKNQQLILQDCPRLY